MITEGVGVTAPVALQLKFSQSELLTVLEVAKERAAFRAYNTRRDSWGRGCKSAVVVPGLGELTQDVRPIFAGTLGEYAVKSWLAARFPGAVELDTGLHEQGDFGVDLTAFGMRMQIKTRQNEQKQSLVRRQSASGREVQVNSITFAFCEWNGQSIIYVLGWCWSQAVIDKPLIESSIGEWKNAVLSDCELNPMSSLRDELTAWRDARCL